MDSASGLLTIFMGTSPVGASAESMRTASRRDGFTLVELLAVIAIIAVLVGLLLPAVQSARESGRRTTCANNLKQLGLALQNHVQQFGHFPRGMETWVNDAGPLDAKGRGGANMRWSWFVRVLPFAEQRSLYDQQWDYYSRIDWYTTNYCSYDALPGKATAVPMFMCPSDPANPKVETGLGWPANQQGFHGNYVLNAGSTAFNPAGPASSAKLNGLVFPLSAITPGHIRDGLSQTLVASEIVLVPDVRGTWDDVRGRYHNAIHAGAFFSTLYTPNTSVPDAFPYGLNTVPRAPYLETTTNIVVSARSHHAGGGVGAGMADGAVKFVADGVDADVWRAAGSRAGGETAHDF